MKKYDLDKQWEIISKGSEEIIGGQELKEKILSKKQQLRAFQELGHKIVFIIGDFTAMIGDPSGRTVERPVLTKEEIDKSVSGYKKQIFKVLDFENIEIVKNSQWLEKLGTEGVIRLASRYTVARMLERNDFSQRYKNGNPITITEFIYPLLQGYDSVEIESDIEIGGTDQKFNLLVGRELQRDMGQEPQAILTMPLLEGTDGVRKMSKSYNNHIGIDELPGEIFGKVMSISDDMMYRYYNLLTTANIDDVKKEHPMEAKKTLAIELVSKYHGSGAAAKAQVEFERIFSKGQVPEEISEYKLVNEEKLVDLICNNNMLASKGEAKRIIKQGGVTLDDKKVDDIGLVLKPGIEGIVRVGKRNFLKIIK
jgi:tyrosyl-tRNA synthetase